MLTPKEIEMLVQQRLEEEDTDYFKLKFEGVLSDYHSMLLIKFHVYVNEFKVSAEQLEEYWKQFALPIPVNKDCFGQILQEMQELEWIKLQDDTGKYLYGPKSQGKQFMPSLMVNRFQLSLNETVGRLSDYFKKGELTSEINDIAEALYQELVALNIWVSTPLMNMFMDKGELTIEQAQACKPYSVFFKDGVAFKDFIRTFQAFGSDKEWELEGHDKTTVLEALLTSSLLMRGICGFSSLCGFLLDATYPSRDFAEPLREIATYILVKFHNSFLYRVELAVSPMNTDKAAEERDMDDHTTRLKIYLFDRQMVPHLVRVDMPHKGEEDMHFNIRTADNKHLAEDHSRISANTENIDKALVAVRDAMSQLCPDMIKWVDSTREDDEKVLSDMLLLKAMDDVSLDYLKGKEDKEHLAVFNSLFNQDYKN